MNEGSCWCPTCGAHKSSEGTIRVEYEKEDARMIVVACPICETILNWDNDPNCSIWTRKEMEKEGWKHKGELL